MVSIIGFMFLLDSCQDTFRTSHTRIICVLVTPGYLAY